MPIRKIRRAASGLAKKSTGAQVRRGLKHAARTTLFAASLTVAQWSVDLDVREMKLFSPGLLDRLSAPLTRFHD
jgi:hypothetical protein